MSKLQVSVHLYRSHGQTVCCIFRSQNRRRESSVLKVHPRVQEGELLTTRSKFDLTTEQKKGTLLFRKLISQECLPFQDSRNALQVLRRLPYPVHFGCGVRFGVVEGGNYAITDIDLWALYKDAVTDRLHYFKSKEEAEKHGVTLLHILSVLQA